MPDSLAPLAQIVPNIDCLAPLAHIIPNIFWLAPLALLISKIWLLAFHQYILIYAVLEKDKIFTLYNSY